MTLDKEIDTIRQQHEPCVLHIAVTQMFCTSLLDHYGRANNHSLQEHIHTIDRMVAMYAQACGFTLGELHAARRSILAAGVSLKAKAA